MAQAASMAIVPRKPSVPVLVVSRCRALGMLALFCGCTPDQAVMPPAPASPPITSSGAAGTVGVVGTTAPTVASTAPSIQMMTAGRSAPTNSPTGGAGKSVLIAGSGGVNVAGAGGTKASPAAIGGSGGRGTAGTAANGGGGGAAGDDSSVDPSDPPSSGTRDVNGPCKDLDLFCFDPFDMFIFNPDCFTCNNGMGCQSCENFQAI